MIRDKRDVLGQCQNSTQYEEIQEVVKLFKSERFSESQCRLHKHRFNYNAEEFLFLAIRLRSVWQSSPGSRISSDARRLDSTHL